MTELSKALAQARQRRGGWSLRTIEGKMADAGYQVSFSTIGNYLKGKHGVPDERVLLGFAAVYPELPITQLRELAGLPPGEPGPWTPPAEADRLTRDQRDALDRLIRTIVGEPRVSRRGFTFPRGDDPTVALDLAARTTPGLRLAKDERDRQDRDAEGPQSP